MGEGYQVADPVVLENDADNSEKLVVGNHCTVTLADRTITRDGTWNTLCLPFDVTLSGSPLQGFTVKELDVDNSYLSSDGELNIKFVETQDFMAAGVPYILKWTGESTEPLTEDDLVFSGVTIINAEPEAVKFSNALGDYCQFVGQYSLFEINDGTAAEGFDSNVNNIDEILFLASDATSSPSSNAWYSLDGRWLQGTPTQKGVYIHRGRKIVVK